MYLCPTLKQTNIPFYFRLVVYSSYTKMFGIVAVNYSSELMMLLRSSLSCLPQSHGTCKFLKKFHKSLQFPLPFLLDIVLGCTISITIQLYVLFCCLKNCNLNLCMLFCFKLVSCFYLEFQVIFTVSGYSPYFTRCESK